MVMVLPGGGGETTRAPTIAEIEHVIRRLSNVMSTRVSGDQLGEVAEIHVVVEESHNPKQIVRDIESALMSELGLRVDRRKISIALVREAEEPATGHRLRFVSIDLSLDRAKTQARVALGRDDDLFAGVSRAAGPNVQQPRLVAEATLAAVEEYLRSITDNGVGRLELADVTDVTSPDGQRAILVAVRVVRAAGEENLLGTALVRDDVWRATACATLDAVNRRLVRLAIA
jgi:hypothetical protein